MGVIIRPRFPDHRRSRSPDHPSWPRDRQSFTLALELLGLIREGVAAFCEARRWGRPSTRGSNERTRFLDELEAGRFPELHTPPPDATTEPESPPLLTLVELEEP